MYYELRGFCNAVLGAFLNVIIFFNLLHAPGGRSAIWWSYFFCSSFFFEKKYKNLVFYFWVLHLTTHALSFLTSWYLYLHYFFANVDTVLDYLMPNFMIFLRLRYVLYQSKQRLLLIMFGCFSGEICTSFVSYID